MDKKFDRLAYLTAEVIDFERRTDRPLPEAHAHLVNGDFDQALYALAVARRRELEWADTHHRHDIEELEEILRESRKPKEVRAVKAKLEEFVTAYGSRGATVSVLKAAFGD